MIRPKVETFTLARVRRTLIGVRALACVVVVISQDVQSRWIGRRKDRQHGSEAIDGPSEKNWRRTACIFPLYPSATKPAYRTLAVALGMLGVPIALPLQIGSAACRPRLR